MSIFVEGNKVAVKLSDVGSGMAVERHQPSTTSCKHTTKGSRMNDAGANEPQVNHKKKAKSHSTIATFGTRHFRHCPTQPQVCKLILSSFCFSVCDHKQKMTGHCCVIIPAHFNMLQCKTPLIFYCSSCPDCVQCLLILFFKEG